MKTDWQRLAAVVMLAALGAGIIAFMVLAINGDGALDGADAAWVTAAFLSLREVFSKIENIVLGIRTPAPPVEPAGENL